MYFPFRKYPTDLSRFGTVHSGYCRFYRSNKKPNPFLTLRRVRFLFLVQITHKRFSAVLEPLLFKLQGVHLVVATMQMEQLLMRSLLQDLTMG